MGIHAMLFIARFLKDESAATAVEYSVMLALVLMAVFASIGLFGSEASALWGNISTSIAAEAH